MIYINRMNVMIKIYPACRVCRVCAVDILNKSKQRARQIYCSDKCRKEWFSKEKTRNNRIAQGKAYKGVQKGKNSTDTNGAYFKVL
jgi:hypothetical protein